MRPTPRKKTKDAIVLMIPAVLESENESNSDLEKVIGDTESDQKDEESWHPPLN